MAIGVGFCLIWPWVICYFMKEGPNIFQRYLDWVYDVVNRRKDAVDEANANNDAYRKTKY